MPSLAIISHTIHYKLPNTDIIGWEPTVREINFLCDIFDKVTHIAPLYSGRPNPTMVPYASNKINFVPLIPSGGRHLKDKLSILYSMPKNIKIIKETIHQVDWIQFRAPCNIGIYVLPMLTLMRGGNTWIKYAGHWTQKNIPLSYLFQRWWLKRNLTKSPVTINGKWKNQEDHVLTFNNPCISKLELLKAQQLGMSKDFFGKLNICFVGRLEKAKGFSNLMEALMAYNDISWINDVHCVGDGVQRKIYSSQLESSPLSFIFHGFINREALNKIYHKSHLIILPSISEGFPKVLIEAASFGCIPVIPNISSISMYINEKNNNGILLSGTSPKEIIVTLQKIKNIKEKLPKISLQATEYAKNYSYEKNNEDIKNYILHGNK